jgi:hypothetical protein
VADYWNDKQAASTRKFAPSYFAHVKTLTLTYIGNSIGPTMVVRRALVPSQQNKTPKQNILKTNMTTTLVADNHLKPNRLTYDRCRQDETRQESTVQADPCKRFGETVAAGSRCCLRNRTHGHDDGDDGLFQVVVFQIPILERKVVLLSPRPTFIVKVPVRPLHDRHAYTHTAATQLTDNRRQTRLLKG